MYCYTTGWKYIVVWYVVKQRLACIYNMDHYIWRIHGMDYNIQLRNNCIFINENEPKTISLIEYNWKGNETK
jgi:hypothetical protein